MAEAGATVPAPEQDPRRRPRRLGDAWLDWDPAQAADVGAASPAALIPALHGLLALLATAAWALLVWLAAPRLATLGLAGAWPLRLWALGTLLLWLPVGLLWGTGTALRYPRWVTRRLQRLLFGLWTPVAALARWLGISVDRLGHSFVRVANRLALRAGGGAGAGGVLILAPRCLQAECMRALRALAAGRHAELVVAGGGEEARAAITRVAPAGVLAIACERDLVAGLRDVAARLPVLSLPNQRPEGPCRNSTIDLDRARQLLLQLETLTSR
jgi:hypothetical protein